MAGVGVNLFIGNLWLSYWVKNCFIINRSRVVIVLVVVVVVVVVVVITKRVEVKKGAGGWTVAARSEAAGWDNSDKTALVTKTRGRIKRGILFG